MVPEHPLRPASVLSLTSNARDPAWLAILAVLALWGVVYLVLYAGSDWAFMAIAVARRAGARRARRGPVDGKALFLTHCSACHQATGGVFLARSRSLHPGGSPASLVKIMLLGVTGKPTVQGSTYTGQMPPFPTPMKSPPSGATGELRYDGAIRRGTGGKAWRTGWAHQAL
jgi:mono/diheme cytochrome c family protein